MCPKCQIHYSTTLKGKDPIPFRYDFIITLHFCISLPIKISVAPPRSSPICALSVHYQRTMRRSLLKFTK